MLQTNPRNAVALKQWNLAIDLHPGDVRLLSSMAWLLATAPEASLRNGAKAVELAQRAARFSADRDPAVLDTLAAAYAEAGRFAEAVETAENARSLAAEHGDTPTADHLQARIKLYRAGSPLRDVPQASPSPHPEGG